MDSLKFIGGCLTFNNDGKYSYKDPSLLSVTATGTTDTKSLGDWVSTIVPPTPPTNIFGTPPNYSEFEADGTLVSYGNATCWDDINVSAFGLGTGASVPSIINIASTTIRTYAYNGNTSVVDELHGSLEILHNYAEGTDIIPHIHWLPSTNSGGDVKWQMEYVWINSDGIPVTSSTTVAVVSAAGSTAWLPKISAFQPISGTGKTIGSRFFFRVFRNPVDSQDTYGNDAAFTDFGVHYQINTLGSRQTYIK